ncbi:MAG: polysaccharide deacetylase family protein, partial [Ginsengibacter sp.]
MLLIYLSNITPRSKYIFDLIFEQHLGLTYRVTQNSEEFAAHFEEKINYSEKRFSDEFFIKPSGFLKDDSLRIFTPAVTIVDEMKVLFPCKQSDTGFDIFSAVFYMTSRYEEYLPSTPDAWGRFSETESIAFKNDFLQIPVVEYWVSYLKNILQKKYNNLQFSTPVFNVLHTYDIDVAYKYKGRGLLRGTGSFFKNLLQLNFKELKERSKTLLGLSKDPWDTYDQLKAVADEKKLKTIFFFLVGKNSAYDRNLSASNFQLKALVKKNYTFSEIGIHPSFHSSKLPEKFAEEKNILEEISNQTILKSRQHFLKFDLPDTYLQLIRAGITEDYSMGFATSSGFRAGTCKPFYFYDLKNEKTTTLKIFPVTYMEGTFFKSHTPEEALKKIEGLANEVKKVNGTFISIWHNHTISEDYSEWKKVH